MVCYKAIYDTGEFYLKEWVREDLQLACIFPVWSGLWAPRECLLSLQAREKSHSGGEELRGVYLHDLVPRKVEGGLNRWSVGELG